MPRSWGSVPGSQDPRSLTPNNSITLTWSSTPFCLDCQVYILNTLPQSHTTGSQSPKSHPTGFWFLEPQVCELQGGSQMPPLLNSRFLQPLLWISSELSQILPSSKLFAPVPQILIPLPKSGSQQPSGSVSDPTGIPDTLELFPTA